MLATVVNDNQCILPDFCILPISRQDSDDDDGDDDDGGVDNDQDYDDDVSDDDEYEIGIRQRSCSMGQSLTCPEQFR